MGYLNPAIERINALAKEIARQEEKRKRLDLSISSRKSSLSRLKFEAQLEPRAPHSPQSK
jgi:hypothetical protein